MRKLIAELTPKTLTFKDFAPGIAIILIYPAVYGLSAGLGVLDPIVLYIPSAVSLAALFFSGPRLWPLVLVAALFGGLMASYPMPLILAVACAEALQAGVGAHFLRRVRMDPLFRKFRDMFYVVLISFVFGIMVPTAYVVAGAYSGAPYASALWQYHYIAMVCANLLVAPFILRWFSKRRFNRNPKEVTETILVLGAILVLTSSIFIFDIGSLGGIPLVYFLLIPLFWVALRLRPRFVTLAFLGIGSIAIGSVLSGPPYSPELQNTLYQVEAFVIMLATAFYIIVSLEEDRRLNANLMRSQLQTLENAVSRISSESRAKNEFIAVLAHELRNPLAPVVSGIDLLKLSPARTKDEEETLTIMEDRMLMVRRLLDDLLDISRIAEKKIAIKSEPVDLDAAIKRGITSTEHIRKERHQALTYKPSKQKLIVTGDMERLEQIFSNLLTNASKYSDPGDPISISVHQLGDMVQVSVVDRGVGIDEHSLKAIFTAFHQVEQGERSIKGLGIGLALVRSFVEAHGGSITAESAGRGKGSTFTITLPLQVLDEQGVVKETEEHFSPSGLRPTVLVVDDNDAAAWGVGRLLELMGCEVTYAYDGNQAVESALLNKPSVVLLDVGLPDMDGYAVARMLREQGFENELIALTGYSNEESRKRAFDAGFDDYIVKPAGQMELRRAILGLN